MIYVALTLALIKKSCRKFAITLLRLDITIDGINPLYKYVTVKLVNKREDIMGRT